MPTFGHPQGASADVRRADVQGMLNISKAPAAAAAKVGQALVGAGEYQCDVRCDDWSVIEVVLMPSAVTGTFAPKIQRMYANGEKVRSETTGSNFAAATAQTLSLSNLNGSRKVRITFTVPGGGSVTFAPGTDPANATALAEWNGA
jgi:hypothetical protein